MVVRSPEKSSYFRRFISYEHVLIDIVFTQAFARVVGRNLLSTDYERQENNFVSCEFLQRGSDNDSGMSRLTGPMDAP